VAEIAAALAAVRHRISAACAEAGRDTAAVTLVAVTKTHPASDVLALAELGIDNVGESRDQEARAKVAEVAESGVLADRINWHFIGRLQTNKARHVAEYAHSVHSVDRTELVVALADGVRRIDRPEPLQVFVQVSLDGDPERGGVVGDDVRRVAAAVAAHEELQLAGVMAVAPIEADVDSAFATLAEVSARLQSEFPQARAISAGMTHDYEAALRHGSTHVRVGTALLGRRSDSIG
jgi:pyridoxal phosphate enzyme (YggS family)